MKEFLTALTDIWGDDAPLTVGRALEQLETVPAAALRELSSRLAQAARDTAQELPMGPLDPLLHDALRDQLSAYKQLSVLFLQAAQATTGLRSALEDWHAVLAEATAYLEERQASDVPACPACGVAGLDYCPQCRLVPLIWDADPREEALPAPELQGALGQLSQAFLAVLRLDASLEELERPLAAAHQQLAQWVWLSREDGDLERQLRGAQDSLAQLEAGLDSLRLSHLLKGWNGLCRHLGNAQRLAADYHELELALAS